MKYDNETNQKIDEAEEMKLLVKGRAWAIIKMKLNKILQEFDANNVALADDKGNKRSAEDIAFQVSVSQSVRAAYQQFIEDIEGDVNRLESLKHSENKEDPIVKEYN